LIPIHIWHAPYVYRERSPRLKAEASAARMSLTALYVVRHGRVPPDFVVLSYRRRAFMPSSAKTHPVLLS